MLQRTCLFFVVEAIVYIQGNKNLIETGDSLEIVTLL